MRDFADSTLWGVSTFDRVRQQTGNSGFMRLGGRTLLPTTLLTDLRRVQDNPATDDVLEVVAACLRHRESALLCLQHEEYVWPVTLFPLQMLVHSPRDLVTRGTVNGLATLKVLTAEPPGVRPPGHWMHERVANTEHYRHLVPLLWTLALNGPRANVLAEIGGRAAYRLVSTRAGERPTPPGALGPAVQRLWRESVSLREMATWPGMSLERASRLLNALYLTGSLLVSRTHPAARDEPARPRVVITIHH